MHVIVCFWFGYFVYLACIAYGLLIGLVRPGVFCVVIWDVVATWGVFGLDCLAIVGVKLFGCLRWFIRLLGD